MGRLQRPAPERIRPDISSSVGRARAAQRPGGTGRYRGCRAGVRSAGCHWHGEDMDRPSVFSRRVAAATQLRQPHQRRSFCDFVAISQESTSTSDTCQGCSVQEARTILPAASAATFEPTDSRDFVNAIRGSHARPVDTSRVSWPLYLLLFISFLSISCTRLSTVIIGGHGAGASSCLTPLFAV